MEPECLAAISTALMTDPGAGLRVISADGRILFINRQAARMFHGPNAEPADLIGRDCRDVYPPEWIRERFRTIGQVISTGRPTMVRVIWDGRQILNWIHPVHGCGACGEEADESGAGPEVQAVIVSRYAPTDSDGPRGNGYEYVVAEVVGLGPLEVLTPRELEVLALLGQGMSVREAARTLFRSEKTIETHRSSIGRKLGIDDRVKLAAVAARAGLTLADAQRPRVDRG